MQQQAQIQLDKLLFEPNIADSAATRWSRLVYGAPSEEAFAALFASLKKTSSHTTFCALKT